jgi:competence protein ComEC
MTKQKNSPIPKVADFKKTIKNIYIAIAAFLVFAALRAQPPHPASQLDIALYRGAFFFAAFFVLLLPALIMLIPPLRRRAPFFSSHRPAKTVAGWAIIALVGLVLSAASAGLLSADFKEASREYYADLQLEEAITQTGETSPQPPAAPQAAPTPDAPPTASQPPQPGPAPQPAAPAPSPLPTSGAVASVHFIDVGQGDCVLIKTPGQNILIDAGTRQSGAGVVKYLKKQSVEQLDLVISTHPHEDHIGGLLAVLKDIPVKEVIDPGVVHTSATFRQYLQLIDQKDIKFTVAKAGQTRDLGGGASFQILHPQSTEKLDLNNCSVVARFSFGSVSLMLTGDAEAPAEQQILSRGALLHSTLLKVGHHASRTSTTPEFLAAVSPETAVIMCGQANSYGHPHHEVLSALKKAEVSVWRTDLHGHIVITTDGASYEIKTQKKP